MRNQIQIPDFDSACAILGISFPKGDHFGFSGRGWAEVRRDGELVDLAVFSNLITDAGDEYYMERAAGISSPPGQVTGMRLGTGTTAVAKNGAGAAIVTYVSGSDKAIDATYPQSSGIVAGAGTTITFLTTWDPGEGTANDIAEVVLTNESPLTDVAGTAANTIARALLSPTIDKAAGDTTVVTWEHTGLGA